LIGVFMFLKNFAIAVLTFSLVMLFVIVFKPPFFPHCFWVLPLAAIFQISLMKYTDKLLP